MASVEKRVRDGRTTYLVRWRDESHRQRKKSLLRKVDADRFRAQVEHQLHTGQYVDPAAGRITFRQYAEQWRAAQPHRPNTAARTLSQLVTHAYPVLGDRPLTSIRPSELQAWATGLSATLAPSSTRPVYSTVRAIFAAAVRDRLIVRTPAERIVLPELPRRQIVPLTPEQVHALVDAMPDRYRAVAVVAAGAGLRRGELFGLQVGDIDFLRHTIAVERQVVLVNNRPQVGPLKTRPSYRTIPGRARRHRRSSGTSSGVPGRPRGLRIHAPGGWPVVTASVHRGCLALGSTGGRRTGRVAARPAALLRLGADPGWAVGQGGVGAARARQRRRDAEHLQSSVARR